MRLVSHVVACVAAVAALPLARPFLAEGVLEWGELLLFPLIGLGLVWVTAATIDRLRRKSPSVTSALGTLYLCGLLSVVGWTLGGAAGAALAPVPLVLLWILARRDRQSRRSQVLALAAPPASAMLFLLVSVVVTVASRAPQPERQVIMVGFDGATWSIIDRLRGEGALPTFQGLVTGGARGELSTLVPTISPPIWTSIASGVSPEQHGVSDFWASSDQVRVKRIWEIAEEYGLVTGVVGYLVTWPPRKQTGFLVPGWLAQDAQTIPPKLKFIKQLELQEKSGEERTVAATVSYVLAAVRNGLTLSTFNHAMRAVLAKGWHGTTLQWALDVRILKQKVAVDVFCHLLRTTQPDLAIFYDSGIDAVQHLFFKYYSPEGFPEVSVEEVRQYGDAIPRMYREADKSLGRVLAAAAANADVVVVSDHGQEAAQKEGERWYSIRTSELLRELDMEGEVRATNVGKGVFLRSVGEGGNLGRVVSAIEEVVSSRDSQSVFEVESDGDRTELRIRAEFDPSQETRLRFREREFPVERFFGQAERVTGVHTTEAMILMHGPSFRDSEVSEGRSVLDVAPTILYVMGLPLSLELEGKVIEEALRGEVLARRAPEAVETYGVPGFTEEEQTLDEETLKRLRALGYVD